MSKAITFTEEEAFAVEGQPSNPLRLIEGSTVTLACTFWGAVTSPNAAVYRNRQNVTSTVMPTGSHIASGSVATLKPLTALVGGARYVIAVTGTVSSDVWVKKIEVVVGRDEDE